MSKVIDLTNKKFGRLTVLYRNGSTKDGKAKWHCICECGKEIDVIGQYLRNGTTQSCGCLQKERTAQTARKNALDITGQKFGRLIAVKPTDKRSGTSVVWECKCDCGNIAYVAISDLKKGNTKSCGCYNKENLSQLNTIDIIGQKFGKLTVLEQTGKNTDGSYNYLCQCDCGNKKIINGVSLRNGTASSCGCINYSIGEKNIDTLLKQNNISFISEYTPKELYNLRFDFAILHEQKIIRLIEFDGRQHYEECNTIWDKTDSLENRQKRDQKKNQWAKENNIPLVRIPYWERDKITLEMIMGDKYLIK